MPHDEIPERRPLRGVSRQFFNGGKGIEAPFAHHVRYGLPHGVLQHVILRVLPSQGNMPVLFYIGGKGFADVLRVPAATRGTVPRMRETAAPPGRILSIWLMNA